MRRISFGRWIVVVVLLTAAGYRVMAQMNASAYLALEGKLYAWTPGNTLLEAVPACDLEGSRVLNLALSPTGKYLALNVVSQEVFEGGYAPTPTGNLWLCDLQAKSITRLTDIDVLSQAISRIGIWSPDGTMLAWGADNADYSAAELWMHDVTSGTTTRIAESMPFDYGCGSGPVPPKIAWSEAGLVAGYFVSSEEDFCLAADIGFSIYAPNGARADLPLSFEGDTYGVGDWYLERDAVLYRPDENTAWRQIRMSDGTVTDAGGVPGLLAPGGDAFIMLDPFAVRLPGVDAVMEPVQLQVFETALSPDGQAALVIAGGTVFAAADGGITVLDVHPTDPDAFSFSYLGTHVSWGAASVQVLDTQDSPCPAVERLYFQDGKGRVLTGLGPNNLRAAPLQMADSGGQLAEGEEFEAALLGSVCSNGIRWRQVRTASGDWWTAESRGSTYYIETMEN